MNAVIKQWCDATMGALASDNERGTGQLLTSEDVGNLVIASHQHMHSLKLHATTFKEGRIPIRQGLKSFNVSPLVFFASLASRAADLATAHRLYSPHIALGLEKVATIALVNINDELKAISNDDINDVTKNHANDFTGKNMPLDLNLFHILLSVKTQPTLVGDPQKCNAAQFQAWLDGVGYIQSNLDYRVTENIGISNVLLCDILSSQLFNHPVILSQLKEQDPNLAYFYRLNHLDFRTAAFLAYADCSALEKAEREKYLLAFSDACVERYLPRINSASFITDEDQAAHLMMYPSSSLAAETKQFKISGTRRLVIPGTIKCDEMLMGPALCLLAANGLTIFQSGNVSDSTFEHLAGADKVDLYDVVNSYTNKAITALNSINFTKDELESASNEISDYTVTRRL